MPKVDGLQSLKSVLVGKKRGLKGVEVHTGFSQLYSLIVHESVDLNFRVGQAKFLEVAYRRNREAIARTVVRVYLRTGSMEKALLAGGLLLQREAQKLTPVDTSALRASAYTALERNAPTARRESFNRSELIRTGRRAA